MAKRNNGTKKQTCKPNTNTINEYTNTKQLKFNKLEQKEEKEEEEAKN